MVALISRRHLIKLIEKLYGKLTQCNFSSKLLNLTKNLYRQVKCQIRTTGEMSCTQNNKAQQGERLSPIFFVEYINEVESRIYIIDSIGMNINRMKVSILMYVYDLVLLPQSDNELQLGINALHSFCTITNLTVNTSKSKCMYLKENHLSYLW